MTIHSADIAPGTELEGFRILKVLKTKGFKKAVLRCEKCLYTFTESTTDIRRYTGHCKWCAEWKEPVDLSEHSYLRRIHSDLIRRNPNTVCPRWMDVQTFADDVGPRPAEPAGHFGNTSAWRFTRDDDRKPHAPWNNFWWAPAYSDEG